jgi:hypothetical protein
MLSAPARDVLSAIKSHLGVEPEWLADRPDGFEWWPGPHAQRIWVEGNDSPRVHIESDFLRDVPETDRTLVLLAHGNRFVTFSAHVYKDKKVRLHASFSVTEKNAAYLARFAPLVAAMQVADADAKAVILAPAFGAAPDHSSHPIMGRRTLGNGALNTLVVLRAENAKSPSAAELDFSPLIQLEPRPWLMGFADKGGMTAEFPFASSVPAFLACAAGDDSGPWTARFQATTDFEHPQLGHGVLLRLTLPVLVGNVGHANGFNVAEAYGASVPGAHQLGGWCWHNDSLVFATFVPSVLFRRSLFEALIYDAERRAIWARDVISVCFE